MEISEILTIKLQDLQSRIIIKSKGYNYGLTFKVRYSKYLPFFYDTNRDIAIKDIKEKKNFTVILYGKKPFLYACAKVEGYNELVNLIYEWLDKKSSIETMTAKFIDFEYLKPFPSQDLDKERENLWFDIKGALFNYYIVWWNLKRSFANYEKLLLEAKSREELKIYYPSLSHHWLRFKTSSNDIDSKYIRGYLMAMNEAKGGDFYVSSNFFSSSKEAAKLLTNDPKEAIDFFIAKCVNAEL